MKLDPHLKARLGGSRRILASYTSKLGDCIHTLPALRVLRAHAPQAEIHYLASNLASPLLDRCVDIDATILMGVDHGSGRKAKRQARSRLMRKLFRADYDVHVDFHAGLDQIVLTTFGARVGHRIGLNTRCDSARKAWFYDSFSDQPWRNQLLADYAVEQLAALGLSAEVPPLGPQYLKSLDRRRHSDLGRYLHVAPFASEGSRELPRAVLAEALLGFAGAHPDFNIAISAAPVPREMAALDALCAELADPLGPRLVRFAGTLDSAQLAELIAGAALHAGCDSGTLHMAVLVGAPSVSWFLNHESITAWAPRLGPHTVLVSALEQSRNGKCLAGIPAGTVAAALSQAVLNPGMSVAQWQFVSATGPLSVDA